MKTYLQIYPRRRIKTLASRTPIALSIGVTNWNPSRTPIVTLVLLQGSSGISYHYAKLDTPKIKRTKCLIFPIDKAHAIAIFKRKAFIPFSVGTITFLPGTHHLSASHKNINETHLFCNDILYICVRRRYPPSGISRR